MLKVDAIEFQASRKEEEIEAGKADYEDDVDEGEEKTFPREYCLAL
jgi:hypothetical protein